MANQLLELRQAKTAALDGADRVLTAVGTRAITAEEQVQYDGFMTEAAGIDKTIQAHERRAAYTNTNIPTDQPGLAGRQAQVYENAVDKPWGFDLIGPSAIAPTNETKAQRSKRLAICGGEYLTAVRKAPKLQREGRALDPRLLDLNAKYEQRASAAGASEAVPSDGGFLVYPDFANEILQLAHDTGVLHPLTRHLPLSEFTNAIKIPAIDEQGRADGYRWGGVQAFWENEAQSVVGSKPTFALLELICKKLTGLFYSTDELLADARLLGTIVMQAFGEEFGFKLDDGVINGIGSGQLLGILKAPALITISKETNQLAATILWENIKKMWARMWPRSRANAVWLINQDAEPSLMSMVQVVGTGGIPVYTPPGMGGGLYGGAGSTPMVNNVELNDTNAGRLMGRPVMVMEQCQTVGTVGDIILFDPTQYIMVDKGDLQAASSMHVRFLTDEMTYRWIFRTDGAPWWKTALLPAHGTNSLSPMVALAARS